MTAERLTLGRAAGQLATARAVVRFVWDHPSNAGGRPRALLRLAGYQFRARLLRRRAIARIGERSRIWVDLHRTGASKVMYANPPDMPEMQVWRQALRGGGLFLDVGANVGAYTIWAAECGAEVIALEPAADTFGLLLENVALNGYRVTAVQAAAGARCGTARFTAGRDAGNHLNPDGPVEARLVTIDSLIGERHVAGMKVDVEGFEIDVLQGCTRALSERRIGLIQLEWNAMSQRVLGTDRRPVADLLAQHGYQLFRPDPQGCLVPVTDPGFGADVFARPAVEHVGMRAAFRAADPGQGIMTAERVSATGQESAAGPDSQDREVLRLFEAKALTWPAKYAPDGPLVGRLASLSVAVSRYAQAEDRVLDLGCGTGELTRALAAAGFRAAGCDISRQMLLRAPRDRGGCAGWLQLEPDWRRLPFASAAFDVVVAASVLEYVAEPTAVLRECARVLRPGGVVLYTVPDLRHPVRWAEWFARRLAGITGGLSGDGRRSRWKGYRAYLRASLQRHRVRWWLAASRLAGLRPVPCQVDGALSPLRLLASCCVDEEGAWP
jgi:FkbM family methyltransferase